MVPPSALHVDLIVFEIEIDNFEHREPMDDATAKQLVGLLKIVQDKLP